MLVSIAEKMKDVPGEELATMVRAVMNVFLVISELKKKEPWIDLKAAHEAILEMDEVEFRAAMWQTGMIFVCSTVDGTHTHLSFF